MAETLAASLFFSIFGGHKSFSWGHWYPCFGLLVMSALGLKDRVDPLRAFSLMWTSDSRLVWHLLTVQGSAWQPSLLDPHTYRCVRKHWWRFGPGLKPTTVLCRAQQARHCRPLGHPGSVSSTQLRLEVGPPSSPVPPSSDRDATPPPPPPPVDRITDTIENIAFYRTRTMYVVGK